MGEYAESKQTNITQPVQKSVDRSLKDARDLGQQRAPAERAKQMAELETEPAAKVGDRVAAVTQFNASLEQMFKTMHHALINVENLMRTPDRAKEETWSKYLGIAIAAVVAGLSGGTSAVLTASIADKVGSKLIGDTVKDLLKKAFVPKQISLPAGLGSIKHAFGKVCRQELDQAESRVIAEWGTMGARLYRENPAEVERLADANLDEVVSGKLSEAVERELLYGWTNFLARSIHGGQHGWDPLKENGGGTTTLGRAIPLKGAAQNPYEQGPGALDPTYQNVAHGQMWWAVDNDQRSMEDDHYGILEIHLWGDGALNTHRGYGMRLDNVGPDIRSVIRQHGRVRDARINKIVRISWPHAGQINPPRADSAFLITADGYIRLTNWAGPKQDLVPLAERAQDLSLGHLEA